MEPSTVVGGMYDIKQWPHHEEELKPLKTTIDSVRSKLTLSSTKWNYVKSGGTHLGTVLLVLGVLTFFLEKMMRSGCDYQNSTAVASNTTDTYDCDKSTIHQLSLYGGAGLSATGLLVILVTIAADWIDSNRVRSIEMDEHSDESSRCNSCKQPMDPVTGMRSTYGNSVRTKSVFESTLNSLDASSHTSSPKKKSEVVNKADEENALDIINPTTYLNAYCTTFSEKYCSAYRTGYLTSRMNQETATADALQRATEPAEDSARLAQGEEVSKRQHVKNPNMVDTNSLSSITGGTGTNSTVDDEKALKERLPGVYVLAYIAEYQKKFCQELGQLYRDLGGEVGKEAEQFVQMSAAAYADIMALASVKDYTQLYEDRSIHDKEIQHLV